MTDREAFERAALRSGPLKKDRNGEYTEDKTRLAWFYWQAAVAHERERVRAFTHEQRKIMNAVADLLMDQAK